MINNLCSLKKKTVSELTSYTKSMLFDIWSPSVHLCWPHPLTVLTPQILEASWFFQPASHWKRRLNTASTSTLLFIILLSMPSRLYQTHNVLPLRTPCLLHNGCNILPIQLQSSNWLSTAPLLHMLHTGVNGANYSSQFFSSSDHSLFLCDIRCY